MENERYSPGKPLWKFILGTVMVAAGCACFVLSCVAAMVLAGRE